MWVLGGTGREGFDEAEVMKTYLTDAGVPAGAVESDGRGWDTEATCKNAAALMQERSWQTAVLVTQYFHVARATLSCRHGGIDVAGASAPSFFELLDIYSLGREVFALPVYAFRGRPI